MAKPPPPESTNEFFGLDLRSGGLNRPVSAYFSPPRQVAVGGHGETERRAPGRKEWQL